MPQLSPHPGRLAGYRLVTGVWVVYTDGGARGNPGPGGAGVVVFDPTGALVYEGGAYLGEVTNNVAEYEALLWGLRVAEHAGARRVRVVCDSELLVKQMNGQYRVRSPLLAPLFLEAQSLRRRFDEISFEHVPRERNAAADRLANQAMDERGLVGNAPQPPHGSPRALF